MPVKVNHVTIGMLLVGSILGAAIDYICRVLKNDILFFDFMAICVVKVYKYFDNI